MSSLVERFLHRCLLQIVGFGGKSSVKIIVHSRTWSSSRFKELQLFGVAVALKKQLQREDLQSRGMAMRSKIWTRSLWSSPAVLLVVGLIIWKVALVSSQAGDGSLDVRIADLLDPKGNCSVEINKFCTTKSEPVVDCISRELKREQAGHTPDDGSRVSAGCKEEWRAFKIFMYKDLMLDTKIETACKDDLETICSRDFYQGGDLECLRKNKKQLSQQCQDEVFVAEEDAANDFQMDPLLNQMCNGDAVQFCKDVSPERGLVQACLRNHAASITYHCRVELFRQETEDAGDLRLNIQLYKACLNDKNKFCPTVLPGNSRVKDCLENNRLEPDFSSSCKEEFDKMLARRSSDFRLNPGLRETCKEDIVRVCASEYPDITPVPSEEPRIIHCLQDYKEELTNAECKKEVHKLLALDAQDYRLDKWFSDSCEDSRQKFCKGSANDKVLSCLQSKRGELDATCRLALFKMEKVLTGDIDYKYAMKQACGLEIGKFCHNLQHDHGLIIECLQQKVADPEMGEECKREIVADELESAKDYRLNFLIRKSCEKDVDSFCPTKTYCNTSSPCGGLVLKCLQDNLNQLTSENCKKALFSFETKEATNILLNVPLQNACQNELKAFCRMSKDHSKSLKCLRAHRNKLSEECKQEELRFSMMEVSDIRLTPSLMNACGTELGFFCPNVAPTNGAAFKCLQLHLDSVDMGKACKVEVDLQEARQASDYRLDVRVRTECKEDVDKFCGSVDKTEEGHATVLKCFVSKYKNLSGGCQTEVSYAVRMALWQYQFNSSLTVPCDDAVKKSCNTSETTAVEGVVIGAYGQCLTTQKRRVLDPACRALVKVATVDGFYIGNSTSTNADIAAALLKFKELKGGDDLSHSGIGFFWVTTVVAFVALLAVALFRRYSGPPKTYTLVVKGGDL